MLCPYEETTTTLLLFATARGAARLDNFSISIFEFPDFLMRGWFRRGMHSMLRDCVDAARGRLLVEAEQLIQRAAALARLIGFLDGLGDVSLCQDHRLAQLLSGSELRGNSGRECASGTVRVCAFDVIAAERL